MTEKHPTIFGEDYSPRYLGGKEEAELQKILVSLADLFHGKKLVEAEKVLNEFYIYNAFRAYDTIPVLKFAIECHDGQLRKDESTPYILHPIRVANRVHRHSRVFKRGDGISTEAAMVKAALLHDTIEDCGARYEEIFEISDSLTMEYVFWLTDIDKSLGDRTVRKRLSSVRLKRAPTEAQFVKCADIADNIETAGSLQDKFFDLFCKEKIETLTMIAQSTENSGLKHLCATITNRINDIYTDRTGIRLQVNAHYG